jgi:hypothetical protein
VVETRVVGVDQCAETLEVVCALLVALYAGANGRLLWHNIGWWTSGP